jgi:hypothetical protein
MKCTPNTIRQNVYLAIAFVAITALLATLALTVR